MNSELKKIIFVTQNLAPFRIDWLDELAKYFHIQILYYNELDLKGKTNPKYMERRPIKALYKKISGNNHFNRAKSANNFIKNVYDSNTIIILDGYGFLEQIFLVKFLHGQKLKYGITIDGIVPKSKKENKIIFKIKQKILINAEFVFSTSKSTDLILNYYGVEKKRIIRHIFTPLFEKDLITMEDINNYKIKYKQKLGYSEKFVILSIGKIIKSKGFDVNLKLAERNPNLYFIIVGGKPKEEYTEYINRKKINNIEFVDFCDTNKLNMYYMAADVFFHPTRSDVWGLVIDEAIAHGLPVITTNKCGAGIELIRNNKNGFIVNVDDIDEMEKKINFLYKNKDVIKVFCKENLKIASENTIEKSTRKDYINLLLWRNKNG